MTGRIGVFMKVLAVAAGLALVAACDSPEERLETHYQDGKELLDNGDDIRAALEFRNALQINADHVPSMFGLSQIEERRANWQAVGGLLSKIVDLDPTHVEATIRLGRMVLLGGQIDRALELSNKAIELAPDSVDALTFKAAVLLNLEDTDGAVEAANKALELDPNSADAVSVLAAQRIAEGQVREAISLLDEQLTQNANNLALQLIKIRALGALEDIAGIEDVLNSLVELYPETRAFRAALIRLFMTQERFDDAEREVRALAEANPEELGANLDVVRFVATVRGTDAAEAELKTLIARGDVNVTQYRAGLTQFYVQQRNIEAAKQTLRDIVASEADSENKLNAKNQIADLLRQEGKPDEARAMLAEVFEEDPKNAGGLVVRAAMQIAERQYDDAILNLRTVLRDAPEMVQAHILLGTAHQANGSIELADDQFARGFEASNGAPSVGVPYAQFLVQKEELDRADQVLTEVIQRNPQNTPALRALAQVKIDNGDWVGAQQVAERLRELEEEAGVVERIIGLALQGQERFDQSIQAFERSQEAAPDAVRPMTSLVGAYVRAGQTDKAKAFLETVLENDPDNGFAQILVAQVHVQENDLVAAEAAFRKAVERAPQNTAVYTTLAGFYLSQGERDKARQAIDDGLAVMPDDLNLRLTRAGFHEQEGALDEALDSYRKLYEASPTSPILANNFAALLMEKRSDPESAQIALEAVQVLLGSNVPQFQDTVGWTFYRLGRYGEALRYLEPAAEELPNLVTIRYHLGMTYRAVKDISGAIDEFEKVVELSATQDVPNLDEVQQMLEELKAQVGTFSGD